MDGDFTGHQGYTARGRAELAATQKALFRGAARSSRFQSLAVLRRESGSWCIAAMQWIRLS